MTTHMKINLTDVKDLAPEHGMERVGQSRFARAALGAQRIGLAHYTIAPSQRLGFGHRHGESEEVYVVIGGSGRFKVGDDVFPVARLDAIYCAPEAWREWEAGPEGMELLAFGGHSDDESSDMDPKFWT